MAISFLTGFKAEKEEEESISLQKQFKNAERKYFFNAHHEWWLKLHEFKNLLSSIKKIEANSFIYTSNIY